MSSIIKEEIEVHKFTDTSSTYTENPYNSCQFIRNGVGIEITTITKYIQNVSETEK